MSTRCTIHFRDEYGTTAIAYRRSYGYPDGPHGVLADFQRFYKDVEAQTADTRYDDPSYLAAKYVVWQAGENAVIAASRYEKNPETGEYEYHMGEVKPLNFLSLGIVLQDPADIEYRYTVNSSVRDKAGRPVLTYEEVDTNFWEES